MAKFNIITPTFNRLEYLIRCIDAAKRMNPNVDYQHIVVDSGSWDGTFEWIQSIAELDTDWWKQITYIRLEENVGDHKAKAIGSDYANGPYVQMLDNDIEMITPNFLTSMAEIYDHLVEHNDCGCLGAKRNGVRTKVIPENPWTVTLNDITYTVGPVNYIPMPFYSNDIIKFKLINGHPRQLPKGKIVFKVGEIMVNHMDSGTMRIDGYNYGDQMHKYPNYFKEKIAKHNEFGRDMVSEWKNK